MRPSKKFEDKTAGQKGLDARFSPVENVFSPATQASGFADGCDKADFWDRLLGLSLTIVER